MARVATWFRLLRWWFTAHHELVAQAARLDRALAVERAEHEKEVAALIALHDQGMAAQREHAAELRAECVRWEQALAESERGRLAEVRRGNEAWQEAGIQRRRADELQAELDRREVTVDAS